MTRYCAMFERLGARGEGAFGAFLMLGDPDLKTSAALLDALVKGGADLVEVGVPFSDPVADGPVIQAAAQRAIAAGVRVSDCFELIAGFRERHADVPVGILTYANIVSRRGGFMREAAQAGADSLLIADVPAMEAEPFASAMEQAGLAPVLIAAANTPPTVLTRIAQLSKAFTYCVSRAGITGAHAAGDFPAQLVGQLRERGAPPCVFGFGISAQRHVRQALAAGASGVICGSAIVQLAAETQADPRQIANFVADMKQATCSEGDVVAMSPGKPVVRSGTC